MATIKSMAISSPNWIFAAMTLPAVLSTAWGQTAPAPAGSPAPAMSSAPAAAPAATNAAAVDRMVRAVYRLGADDVISIKVVDADEISDKAIRVGTNGSIVLPMVGRLQVGGLTAEEVERELTTRLKPFIRNPDVSVSVAEQKSQPVTITGAVRAPGVLQLQGRKTLLEILSTAGGAREDAGYRIRITRQKEWGPIPLPNAAVDPSGQFSVAEVDLKEITEARNPAENILVMPNDVISVPKGELVYVIGDVKRSGGFVLSEKSHVSVLQALSMAAGLEKTASSKNAKILRIANASDLKRTEIAVNLKNILAGKDEDIAMRPDDILFVPGSKTRPAVIRGLEAALQVGTSMAIYRGL
jgi:polysaccharide export outer membrane protein